MSVVTTIIITCSILEDNDTEDVFPAIDFLNEYLASNNRGTFKNITEHFGGNKYPQINIFGGAFNWLDMQEFANKLLQAPWFEPENVILLVNGEHDDCAREVRLITKAGYNVDAEQLAQILGTSVDNGAKP